MKLNILRRFYEEFCFAIEEISPRRRDLHSSDLQSSIRLKRKTSIKSHQGAIRSNRLREEFQLLNTSFSSTTTRMNLYKLKRHKLWFYIKDNFLPRNLTALVVFSCTCFIVVQLTVFVFFNKTLYLNYNTSL